jgi:hypothetical protein
VRRVGGWCEIAASLEAESSRVESLTIGSQLVQHCICSEMGDNQRGHEALNTEVEGSRALKDVTRQPMNISVQQTAKI